MQIIILGMHYLHGWNRSFWVYISGSFNNIDVFHHITAMMITLSRHKLQVRMYMFWWDLKIGLILPAGYGNNSAMWRKLNGVPFWNEQKTAGRKPAAKSKKMFDVLKLFSVSSYWWTRMSWLQKHLYLEANGYCYIALSVWVN